MSKQITIVGLGKTGLSCAKFLARKGIAFAMTDSRMQPPGLAEFQTTFPNTPLSLGRLDPRVLHTATQIILSPGVALTEPAIAQAIQKNIPVIGDIELFAQHVNTQVVQHASTPHVNTQLAQHANIPHVNTPVIGITGTNAKSTVTTLVGEMIRQAGYHAQVGGNLGTAALDLLIEPAPNYYVLELSSFQLESTYSLHLNAATILNLSPDHLDRYASMEEYRLAKQRIYQHCDLALWNRQDLATKPDRVCPAITFGADEPQHAEFGLRKIDHEIYLAYGKENLISIKELKLVGEHNWINALAALAIGHSLKLPFESMLNVLRSFTGLAHRCQLVRERNAIKWYNDSKATNIGATISAVEGVAKQITGKIVLLAGGEGKGFSFDPLQAIAKQLRHVVLIGKSALEIAQSLEGHTAISFAPNFEQAITNAAEIAQPYDAVLLAPACASFDMFRDYVHRGERFTELVNAL